MRFRSWLRHGSGAGLRTTCGLRAAAAAAAAIPPSAMPSSAPCIHEEPTARRSTPRSSSVRFLSSIIVYHHKAGGRDSPRRSTPTTTRASKRYWTSSVPHARPSSASRSIRRSPASSTQPIANSNSRSRLRLEPGMNVHALRLDITRAQKPIARRPDAKPDGGNDQKRIRITLTSDDHSFTYDHLLELLAGTRSEASDPSREVIRTLLLDGTTADQIAARYGRRRGPWLVALEEEAKLDQSSMCSHRRA